MCRSSQISSLLLTLTRTDIGEIRIFSRDEKKEDDKRHDFQAMMPEVTHKMVWRKF